MKSQFSLRIILVGLVCIGLFVGAPLRAQDGNFTDGNFTGNLTVAGYILASPGASSSGGGIAALGTNATASGSGSVAMGYGALAPALSSLAFGPSTKAYGSDSVALGTWAETNNNDSLAIGTFAYTVYPDNIAIGFASYAGYACAISIGNSSAGIGAYTVSIGSQAVANYTAGIAIGLQAHAGYTNGVAIGPYSYAGWDGTIELGPYPDITDPTGSAWNTYYPQFVVGNGYTSGNTTYGINSLTILTNGYAGFGDAARAPTEQVDIAGRLRLENTTLGSSIDGTLGWNGSDLQLHKGGSWISLTTGASIGSGLSSNSIPLWNGTAFTTSNITSVSGSIGIGKASPAYTLDVNGTGNFTGLVTGNGGISTGGTLNMGSGNITNVSAGTVTAPGLSFNTSFETGIYSPGTGSLALTTCGTEALRVTSAGYVGIGTTAPDSPLTVSGAGHFTGLVTASGGVTTAGSSLNLVNGTIQNVATGNVTNPSIGFNGTTTGIFATSSGNLALATNGTPALAIDGGGNFTIGNTTANAPNTTVTFTSNTTVFYSQSYGDIQMGNYGD